MPRSSSRRHHRRRRSKRTGTSWWRITFKWLAIFGFCAALIVVAGAGYLYSKISPTLPDVAHLSEVQLQMPMRVFTSDGQLVAEYGEKRREPVFISEVPDILSNAIIASEDQHFYSHPGVAWQGLARAGLHLVKTGKKGPGGSTITMQVARNFFLTRDRTYARKLTEIFLSLKIERELAKDQILELYINKIYLGQRAYGFAAAARVYYNKDIGDLTLPEAAMLAGLPKAPSTFNPIVNPERATIRRNYVLGRMLDLGMISATDYTSAKNAPVTASQYVVKPDVEANYVGEMARTRIKNLFGDTWATAGYRVFTTIDSKAQEAANLALRNALYNYELRHGYQGPVDTLDPEILADADLLFEQLDTYPEYGDLMPAAVVAVSPEQAVVITREGAEFSFDLAAVEWARERISVDERGDEITAVNEVLNVGDVINIQMRNDGTARFVQEPSVEGAFVSVSPTTGQIQALVGGFDYYRSKFNRVTQARRQPGSTFKPFIYSAALEYGDTPATIYNDAPVVFHDAALEGEWRPQNYSGRFFGPTRLREALVKSRNLVSIRVLREITVPFAIDHAKRFGFEEQHMPPDLSLSLGSASVTPMELASSFGVFANGGYKIEPHFIERIEDPRGNVIYTAPKVVLCDDCDPAVKSTMVEEMRAETLGLSTRPTLVAEVDPDTGEISSDYDPREAVMQLDIVNAPLVVDPRNAYIMNSMMRDVVRRGTARRAGEALGRSDLGGKTGTTNNQLDAWFSGFSKDHVAAAWIGSDGLDPLGRGEAGGVAALPIWTEYMQTMLQGVEDEPLPEPEGLERVRIDWKSGQPSAGDSGGETLLEYFYAENQPEVTKTQAAPRATTASSNGVVAAPASRQDQKEAVEELF